MEDSSFAAERQRDVPVLDGLSQLEHLAQRRIDIGSFGARQANHAAITRSGNTIFSLEDDSELVVIRLNKERFEPVTRYKVAGSETWTQPVVSGNRIFVKDVTSLTLWTIN